MEPINFENTQVAFAHKSNADLKKAHLLFRTFNSKFLISTGPALAKFALDIGLPVKSLIKNTIFAQFCGGETVEECTTAVNALAANKIYSILDYSAEGMESEENFEHTLQETLRTIENAEKNKNIAFCVFKVTGIARFALLEKWNAGERLTEEEEKEKERVIGRFNRICENAWAKGVKILVDAEESWIQDVIDRLTMDCMEKFNRNGAIVYNTIQLYRHDRLEYLKKCIGEAIGSKYTAGFKLVRGAYMEKEGKRAQKKGYHTPIQPDKESTDRDYNKALQTCLEHIKHVAIIAGTHNEQSSRYLASLMENAGLIASDSRVWFSQLLGMSDHISFNLASRGYNVCKYVPYAPVKKMLPYLGRRAMENSSVKGQAGRELQLIEKELKRRKN